MEEIIITQIVLDSEYQIRDHLEEWRIQEFESIYERLPPILLGRIDGQLKLLDGWHRHAAATRHGEMIMRANIIACDENTAYEIAGRANADVALPLKTKEPFSQILTIHRAQEFLDLAEGSAVKQPVVLHYFDHTPVRSSSSTALMPAGMITQFDSKLMKISLSRWSRLRIL